MVVGYARHGNGSLPGLRGSEIWASRNIDGNVERMAQASHHVAARQTALTVPPLRCGRCVRGRAGPPATVPSRRRLRSAGRFRWPPLRPVSVPRWLSRKKRPSARSPAPCAARWKRQRRSGISVTFVARRGDPFSELGRVAGQAGAEAVVVGASAKAGHRLVGSLAVRLVRAGRWPVTVVP
jgi:nucleotide-binding universal stress UspA family protein